MMTLDDLAKAIYESGQTGWYLPFGWDDAPPGAYTKQRCRAMARAVVLALKDDVLTVHNAILDDVRDWSPDQSMALARLVALVDEADAAPGTDHPVGGSR